MSQQSNHTCIFLCSLISLGCVSVCATNSSISCTSSCELEAAVLRELRSLYDRTIVTNCVRPCRCGKDQVYAYPDHRPCPDIQSLAMKRGGPCSNGAWDEKLAAWMVQDPVAFVRAVVENLRINPEEAEGSPESLTSREVVNPNPWENWCKGQCKDGMGGSACNCDILPWFRWVFFLYTECWVKEAYSMLRK